MMNKLGWERACAEILTCWATEYPGQLESLRDVLLGGSFDVIAERSRFMQNAVGSPGQLSYTLARMRAFDWTLAEWDALTEYVETHLGERARIRFEKATSVAPSRAPDNSRYVAYAKEESKTVLNFDWSLLPEVPERVAEICKVHARRPAARWAVFQRILLDNAKYSARRNIARDDYIEQLNRIQKLLDVILPE